MTDDIVTRLRGIQPFDLVVKNGFLEIPVVTEAADEIERLRNDLAEARHEYQKLWERTSPSTIMKSIEANMWRMTAEQLARELGKIDYAQTTYEDIKEAWNG